MVETLRQWWRSQWSTFCAWEPTLRLRCAWYLALGRTVVYRGCIVRGTLEINGPAIVAHSWVEQAQGNGIEVRGGHRFFLYSTTVLRSGLGGVRVQP